MNSDFHFPRLNFLLRALTLLRGCARTKLCRPAQGNPACRPDGAGERPVRRNRRRFWRLSNSGSGGRFGVLRKVSGGQGAAPLDILSFRCYDVGGAAGILPGWTDAGFPAPLRSFAELGAIPPNSALGRPALGCDCVPRTGVKRRSAVCFPLRFLPFLDGLAAGAAQTGTGLCGGWKRWRAVAGFAFQPAVPHRV